MALVNILSKFSSFIQKGAGTSLARLNTFARTFERTAEDPKSNGVLEKVKELIAANVSRNFAVVYVMGKQKRVTDGDLIIVEGHWPPQIGDELTLDKVLLAGSRDFTLVGRPLVQPGLVRVQATVVGKQLSVTRTHFRKKPKKQYMRINFVRAHQTILRINRVAIGSNLNEPSNVLKSINEF